MRVPVRMGIAAPPWDLRGRDMGARVGCHWGHSVPLAGPSRLPGSPRRCPMLGVALRDPVLRARLVLPRREGSNRE